MLQSNVMSEKEIKQEIKGLSDNIKDCLSIDTLVNGSGSMSRLVRDLLEYATVHRYRAHVEFSQRAFGRLGFLQDFEPQSLFPVHTERR